MSNYFHTDDDRMLEFLERVVKRAREDSMSLRLAVDANNGLKIKLGGGMWTPAFDSTFDSYRDEPYKIEVWEDATIHN